MLFCLKICHIVMFCLQMCNIVLFCCQMCYIVMVSLQMLVMFVSQKWLLHTIQTLHVVFSKVFTHQACIQDGNILHIREAHYLGSTYVFKQKSFNWNPQLSIQLRFNRSLCIGTKKRNKNKKTEEQTFAINIQRTEKYTRTTQVKYLQNFSKNQNHFCKTYYQEVATMMIVWLMTLKPVNTFRW